VRSEAERGGRRNKMRGKVAVAVVVVIACALFLVPYASADVEITCSVYPEEAKFDSEFVYSITLTNPTGHEEVGGLGLIVGSNSDNKDISREWDVTQMVLEQGSCTNLHKRQGYVIKMPAGASCTYKTRVYFTDSELKQGAFGDWAETENPEHPMWDKAWYNCTFAPWPFGPKVVSEVRGKPILTRRKEIFSKHQVEQDEAYKDLSFDYSIKVWANSEDQIELQVRNYSKSSSSRWDKHGLKSYTDVYTNETLTWPAVNLTPDNFDAEGHGLYKFVGNISESQPYSGPTIEEIFKDPKVSYKKTIDDLLSFDYEVSVEIDQIKDSIELEVYNYALHDWEQKGIRNYTTPGKPQKLKWESIILSLSSEYFDDDLSGKYRFVGKYKTSENIGPTIEERFYDLRVTPTEGENNVTFNYSVTVNANISDKIELQVKNHTIKDKWNSKGTRDYTTPNINETLTWHNIELNTLELNRHNDSLFRFVGMCGAKSSEKGLPIWPIKPIFRNPSVKPERGLYSENYIYSVDVKAEKIGTVNLSIFCPDGILLYETPLDYDKAPEWQTLNWPVQNFKRCDVKIGDAGYRFGFWYKRNEIINLTGEKPYIGIAKFENETLEPEPGTYGTLFNYTINVTAAHVGTVELLTKCPEATQWATKGEKEYDTPNTRKTLTWTRIKLPCDNCGNAEYMFRFEPGYVPSKIYTGPELIIEDFGALIVTPEKGTNYTPFNFSIDFSTSKPRNVTLWARYDEGEWERIESKPVASKHETILFSNITPSKVFRSIEWKCKGIVNESGITRTNWDINLTWLNRNVSPKEEGWWYETYNFSVRLSANVPGDVVLMVKEEDSNEWMAVGNRQYTDSPNPQTLTWENERIFSAYEGNTSYNFSFYWGKTGYADTPSHGPKLFIPLNISILSSSVIPNDGVLYNFKAPIFSDNSNTRFNFSITLAADKPTVVKLVLVDPKSNKKHTLNDDRKCKYTTPHQPSNCSWTMIELSSEEDVGEWEYTYSYYDTSFEGWKMSDKRFKGPDIIAVFNSYTLDPAPPIPYGEVCNVTVCMSGLEKMDVRLEAYNLIHNRWDSVGTESYEPGGEKCLCWVIDTFDVPFDKLRLTW
jgi:hypothetical protein